MTTQYGYRKGFEDNWTGWTRGVAQLFCVEAGYTLIAREVSEPRVVSIRA